MPVIEPAYTYRATVRSIYDGDTIRVDMDLGFNIWFNNQSLRLHGIDAPELRGEERSAGLKSKEFLESLIPVGTKVIIESYKDRSGKYGRWICTVWKGGTDINQEMIKHGFAKVYEE